MITLTDNAVAAERADGLRIMIQAGVKMFVDAGSQPYSPAWPPTLSRGLDPPALSSPIPTHGRSATLRRCTVLAPPSVRR
ncbi:hypothetical protein [Microvirga tunisiensis]|uniref:hypothetical protein n=1 Tax=Microvirga tunisiensis TaxID=2108360 RepID=UPI001FCEE563|nr:hypothetical protein [Microvirga tunisiensis]